MIIQFLTILAWIGLLLGSVRIASAFYDLISDDELYRTYTRLEKLGLKPYVPIFRFPAILVVVSAAWLASRYL